jgi:hypothetical protein
MPIAVRRQDEFSKFDYLLEFELKEFRQYTIGLEESIKRIQYETKKKIDEEIWPDKSEPIPYYAITISNHVDLFTPNLFYKSTLTALYSFFESALREIVKTAREKSSSRIKVEDLKGNGITLYRDYLVKVVGLDLVTLNDEWSRINNARHVRNSIVHNDYENSESKKTKLLIKICAANDFLDYSCEVTIKDSKYLSDFIDDIQKFLKGLIKIMRDSGIK